MNNSILPPPTRVDRLLAAAFGALFLWALVERFGLGRAEPADSNFLMMTAGMTLMGLASMSRKPARRYALLAVTLALYVVVIVRA